MTTDTAFCNKCGFLGQPDDELGNHKRPKTGEPCPYIAAVSTPPTDTDSSRGEADVLNGIEVAKTRISPLMKYGEDAVWRPAQAAYEALTNAARTIAALSIPQSEPTLTEAEEAELVERINSSPYIPQSEAPTPASREVHRLADMLDEISDDASTAQTEGSGLAEELAGLRHEHGIR